MATVDCTRKNVFSLESMYKNLVNCNIDFRPECQLWGCGATQDVGQLGLNCTTAVNSYTVVPGGALWTKICTFGEECGTGQSVIGLKCDGTLWTWGCNIFGQLGHNTKANAKNNDYNNNCNRSSPTQIPGTTWCAIERYSGALKTDGTLWVWGCNGFGELGQNNLITYSSPVQVPGTTWSSISKSSGIKSDGTLWRWGTNCFGALGVNRCGAASTGASSPTQVPGITWCKVKSGIPFDQPNQVLALKTNGTLWGWGHNQYGQIGNGAALDMSSPVQVPGTTWCDIHVITHDSLGIKTDGTLWSWGRNNFGQLGISLPSGNDKSSPTQIPGITWKCVTSTYRSCSTSQPWGFLAVKTDGTLWIWGCTWGTNYSSPVQVPGITWIEATSGHSEGSSNYYILGLKSPP